LESSLRAQRSNPKLEKAKLDCFVASLVAMTWQGRYAGARKLISVRVL
jgi:hypothetical protein